MFKRRWVAVLSGVSMVTLVACGRSTRNHDTGGDPSMAGAGSEDDGGLSGDSTGTTSGAGPSAGGSGTSTGSGSSAGDGGMGATGNGGSGAGGGSGGDVAAGGDAGTGATGGVAGSANGGSSAGGDGGGTGGSSNLPLCDWGTYDTDLTDDVLTCEPWTTCEEGFQAEFPDSTHDRVCAPCPEDTWNDVPGFSCKALTKCAFGEEVAAEPTETSDRLCVDATVFPQQHYDYAMNAHDLVVTDRGAYLAAWDPSPTVLHFSPSGEDLSSWTSDEAQLQLIDLSAIGDQLFVSNSKAVTDADAGVFSEPGFVQSFSAEGTALWQHVFDDDPSEHFTKVRSAGRDGELYTVAKVEEISCTIVEGGVQCLEGSRGPSKLVLSVLDTDGDDLSYTVLEAATNVSDIVDIEIAADGQVYVAVRRQILDRPDRCDEISEADDPTYYYYYCNVAGYMQYSLLRIDGDEVVAEYDFGIPPDVYVERLSIDASDTVYAVARDAFSNQYTLYRLDGDEVLSGHAVDLQDDEWLDAFTVTDSGLAFVGRTNQGPLLVRTDHDGQVVSRVVLEDVRTPYRFSGIQAAPDGRLFVAGTSDYTTVFVVPWPE